MCYFVCDTIQDTFCSYFTELMPIVYIHRHFCTIGYIIIGLYLAARETGQFQVPMPKAQDNKPKTDQQQPLAIPLPQDKYLDGNQARQMLVIRNDSLPAPSSVK